MKLSLNILSNSKDDLLSLILHGHIGEMAHDKEQETRKSLAQLFSFILEHCSADKYGEVLKVMDHFLSYISKSREDDLNDLDIVVDSLIKTFQVSQPEEYFISISCKWPLKETRKPFDSSARLIRLNLKR